uniref:Fructose-1,6-bisphosphatase isozyme 2 n=1 Tax=Onchocerca volvulus TaxID=6282 RepID=A0A8R1Y168_ONCVO
MKSDQLIKAGRNKKNKESKAKTREFEMRRASKAAEYGMETDAMTLQRFVLQDQRRHPTATGDLTNLLTSLLTAIKAISSAVRKAGIVRLTGLAGTQNIQGEDVKKLDIISNEYMINMLQSSYTTCAMISEENDELIEVPPSKQGKYIVTFDPLDGSSNIDCLASIGTIFGIYKRQSDGPISMTDFLQKGRNIVAAGYALYGSATMLVLSTGRGVNGFTLDPSVGEFILTNRQMKIPQKGKIYSVNEGNTSKWSKGIQEYVHTRKFPSEGQQAMNARYVGSMVSDIHRTLLYGGIFMYPGMKDKPMGKLRLLYENIPMAYIIEQAGGMASNGTKPILDIVPTSIHDRSPLFLGSPDDDIDLEIKKSSYQSKRKKRTLQHQWKNRTFQEA